MRGKSYLYMSVYQQECAYNLAKNAKVGETIVCPSCGRSTIKKSHQQAFCGLIGKTNKRGKKTLCKDRYWNRIIPSRHNKGQGSVIHDVQDNEFEFDDYLDSIHPSSEDAGW